MKIAFVWKWGSGKTTLTGSFIRYLQEKDIFTIAIDADINVWLGSSIGISSDRSNYISSASKVNEIRNYLIGDNTRIASVNHMVKTTPPWKWSRLINRQSEEFFNLFCSFQNEFLKFLHVGTYESEGIWISCYHTSLSIFENILSHTFLKQDELLVTDMVAWNDVFSNTLFTQFDILCLIVEPTIESISMVKCYIELYRASQSSTKILILANKIEDENDINYLKRNDVHPDFIFEYEKGIKHARQKNELYLSTKHLKTWNDLLNSLSKITIQPEKKLQEIHMLHRKYIELDYIKNPLWDLSEQIDTEFYFPWK